jgi:hypothetical protein
VNPAPAVRANRLAVDQHRVGRIRLPVPSEASLGFHAPRFIEAVSLLIASEPEAFQHPEAARLGAPAAPAD